MEILSTNDKIRRNGKTLYIRDPQLEVKCMDLDPNSAGRSVVSNCKDGTAKGIDSSGNCTAERGKIMIEHSSFGFRNEIHKDDGLFTCNVCPYKCKEKQQLVAHLRIHTVERPYKCNICQKLFRLQSALRAHRRVHTGERDVCHKSFTQQGSRNGHIQMHTGKRPYNHMLQDVPLQAFSTYPQSKDSPTC